jgi:hypothetical protein
MGSNSHPCTDTPRDLSMARKYTPQLIQIVIIGFTKMPVPTAKNGLDPSESLGVNNRRECIRSHNPFVYLSSSARLTKLFRGLTKNITPHILFIFENVTKVLVVPTSGTRRHPSTATPSSDWCTNSWKLTLGFQPSSRRALIASASKKSTSAGRLYRSSMLTCFRQSRPAYLNAFVMANRFSFPVSRLLAQLCCTWTWKAERHLSGISVGGADVGNRCAKWPRTGYSGDNTWQQPMDGREFLMVADTWYGPPIVC